ncbi:MAG: CoA transferase [Dehalococcoidia bacterium]|jgi:formyl-CoA transferase|nr:CoA transferase [Dehalococcoidia bacterium]
MGGALEGTRVLDLVKDAGAYGPKLLAGMGADVVRVELPGSSQQRRRHPLYRALPRASAAPAGAEEAEALSLYFLHYNSGKRGVTLDYRTSRGGDCCAA